MVEQFSLGSAIRKPKDIELVEELTLQQISDWIIQFFSPLPTDILQKLEDMEALKLSLSPVIDEFREGDGLWRCQSKIFHPNALIGHQGIALVRGGIPIIYIKIIQH